MYLMDQQIIPSKVERLARAIDFSWSICVQRIASERIRINKESSLQLHLGAIIKELGELACVERDEKFTIELETKYERQSIDILCSLDDVHAAIELKCFRKASNRATDTDMYDVLNDLVRLESYRHVTLRRFICLTDNEYYPKGTHSGHANSVSIRHEKEYRGSEPINCSWRGLWKDKSRDKELVLTQNQVQLASNRELVLSLYEYLILMQKI